MEQKLLCENISALGSEVLSTIELVKKSSPVEIWTMSFLGKLRANADQYHALRPNERWVKEM